MVIWIAVKNKDRRFYIGLMIVERYKKELSTKNSLNLSVSLNSLN
jgi:hypothetical protein